MDKLHIITPVKDSVDSTLHTVEAIMTSRLEVPFTYTIYNDFSTPENTARLEEAAAKWGFRLVNLCDLTSHPSPNYLLVLQTAQREALAAGAGLCIVESDVVVRPDTLQGLYDGVRERPGTGIAASVTVDDEGKINYPYLYARGWDGRVVDTRSIAASAARSSRPPCSGRSPLRGSTPRKTGST